MREKLQEAKGKLECSSLIVVLTTRISAQKQNAEGNEWMYNRVAKPLRGGKVDE
jgi:hypothetical protein